MGIIAQMAYEPSIDSDLAVLDASHLFAPSVTQIGFRKGTFLRRYMLDFIEGFAPHLDVEMVQRAVACGTRKEREALFDTLALPVK